MSIFHAGLPERHSFTITVNNDVNSNSIHIYNDGTASLQVNNIVAQKGSAWITVNSPYSFPFSIESGQSKDVYVSINRQGLTSGSYSDNIIITSNDPNNGSVSVPITLDVVGDTDVPPAPQNLSVNPSSWYSAGSARVSWTNPDDPSGISGAYYKTGKPPASNTDGIYTTSKPFDLTPSNEGEQIIYLWLMDGGGNIDYSNMNAVTLYYDASAPAVLSKYPESGETNVPIESGISAYLTDQYSGIDQASIVMTVNGAVVTPTISGDVHGYNLSYTPAQAFAYGQNISVTINAKDFSSPQNVMSQVSWSFTTATGQTTPILNSFFINNDATSTSTRSVTLNNSATGSPTHYMASEDSGFTGATWQAYSAAPNLILSQGNDVKTVYLKIKNAVGESNVLNDNIALTEIGGKLQPSLSSGSEIYTPSLANYQYRYGPSIILNGNTIDLWATAPGPGDPMDYIQHRRGTVNSSGIVQWLTDWTNAIAATPGSLDQCSTADPSVVYFGGYYYIGYTSTDQCVGGGKTGNQVFVARCNGLPDGSVTCEKWNGSGWGGSPQPIIHYSGTSWGKGQPSFVVKDNILYIYYTDDGTKVVTADATNENWPLLIDEAKAVTIFTNDSASTVLGGKPGPFEVKYIDAYLKFIGIGVSSEFSTNSNIFVYESTDGISFQPVATSSSYWGSAPMQPFAHNIGSSGDSSGHLDADANNFFAYGYGLPASQADAQGYNARWPTYLNLISVTADAADNRNLLSIIKSGTGTGTITSAPAGINCGDTCSALMNEAQVVTLTAAATSGSVFTGWSGGSCSGIGTCVVTMDAAKNVAAAFNLLPVVPTPPTTGAIGSDITLNGFNFGATQGSGYVNFNGTRGTIVSWSNTRIVVKIPSGAASGCLTIVSDYGTSSCIDFTIVIAGEAGILFQDDFNDNNIDAGKWTYGGNIVTEANGIMKLDNTVTDQYGWIQTQPIKFSPSGQVIMTRKAIIHYSNQYINMYSSISIDGLPGYIGVGYSNSTYSDGIFCPITPGFYLVNNANLQLCDSVSNRSQRVEPLWDTWFNEKIVYTPNSGLLEYFINDVKQTDLNVGVLPTLPSYGMTFRFDASGWYTGHSNYFDDLLISQESDSALYASFTNAGIWKYSGTGTTWTQTTTSNPQLLVTVGSDLYGTFEGLGIWKFNGTTWNQTTTSVPQMIVGSSTTLYGAFSGLGIWQWNGSAWSQTTSSNPQTIIASTSDLYGTFSGLGIWKWDGTAWSNLTTSIPDLMVTSGTKLYGAFSGLGIWLWNGTQWEQASTSNPQMIAASSTKLYGSFAGAGIWEWDGAATWKQISTDTPTQMTASGTELYAAFTGVGIKKWDGTTWSLISGNEPAGMVVGE